MSRGAVVRTALILSGTLVAVWVAAAPAEAASSGNATVSGTTVLFRAGAGQTNQVVVTRSGRTLTIDDRVTVRAGSGCVAVKGDSTKAKCTTKSTPTRFTGYLYDGNDSVRNNAGIPMTAYAGAGNDKVIGGTAGETLFGEAGNDSIWGNGGNDTVNGGTGNDSLNTGDGNDVAYGGDGKDTIVTGAGNDYPRGDAGNDAIYTQDGNDHVWGGPGNDRILGGNGNDVAYGEAGDDEVSGDAGNDNLDGGTGNDYLTGGLGNDTMLGQDGLDSMQGGAGDDRAWGAGGEDNIWAETGNDYVSGGDGDDNLDGGDGTDTIYGGPGRDTIGSGLGNDQVNGGPDSDYFRENHVLKPGVPDADLIIGGGGGDFVSYEDRTLAVTADADGVSGDDGQDGEHDTISADVHGLRGGNADDKLSATAGDFTLEGGPGDDTLIGADGRDYLVGGPGRDHLDGGPGDDTFEGDSDYSVADPISLSADVILGGDGRDLVLYRTYDRGVTVDLDGEAGDDGAPGEGDTVGADVEDIDGTDYADHLTGNAGDNDLDGYGSGAGGDGDVVYGLAGNDHLDGRYVYGGPGDDNLSGSSPNQPPAFLDGGDNATAWGDECFGTPQDEMVNCEHRY
ncbi:Ca2+-binding RTX toxin-like protein [Actinoplanes tereljensis]|uniref:Calcium-binding protein n=1 Tax=Paractinoplanes tereljensis TaxID=571912 RepID=A0A919NNY9_9ACTN|nr:calcium-binding protein [Actinoplanes tereljensis]GIF21389.1 hypothetical protein Ate02nite_41190 [Actinoplanes tereljensis]